MSVSEFNEITPYELMIYLEAYNEKDEAKNKQDLTLVWLGEYYHRIKRLPPLKGELDKLTSDKHAMSDEEMLEMVKTLNAQFGGNFEEGR